MRGERSNITITGDDATTLGLMLEILSHIKKLRGDLKNRADSPTFSFTGLALFTHACPADSIKKNKIELLEQLFNNLLENKPLTKLTASNEALNGNTKTLYERCVALPFQKEAANPLNKLKSYLENKSTEIIETLTTLTTAIRTDLDTMIDSLIKLESELEKIAPNIKIISEKVKELRKLQKRDSITVHTRNPEHPLHTYFTVTYPFSNYFDGDDKLKITRQYEFYHRLIKTYQYISQEQKDIASSADTSQSSLNRSTSPFLPHSSSLNSLEGIEPIQKGVELMTTPSRTPSPEHANKPHNHEKSEPPFSHPMPR